MNERKLRMLYVLVDYLSTLVGVIVFSFVRYIWLDNLHSRMSIGDFFQTHGVMLTMLLYPVFMLLIYYLSGFYVTVINKSRVKEFMSTFISGTIGTFSFFMVVLLNDVLPRRISNYELFLIFFCVLFATVYFARLSLTSILLSLGRSRHGKERLIYIGESKADKMQSRSLLGPRREIVANIYIGEDSGDASGEYFRRRIDAILAEMSDEGFGGFFISLPIGDTKLGLKILGELYIFGKPIYVSTDDYRLLTSRVVYDNLFSGPVMDVSRSELSDAVVSVKRAFDVMVSFIGLIVSLPVLAVLAVAIKLSSHGPVFYTQERVGYHRKPFRLCKLRSMVVDAESDGPALSKSGDPRVTSVGRFMRKYRLDELPNLWNVLRGDMSLVGPRPEREFFLAQMRQRAPYCALLHQVRPGLTSLGMVKYGYASSVDEMVERLKYDLIYIQNLSVSLDIRILIYTIRTVFSGEGK